MTFTEYKNQVNPVRKPDVILEPNEYQVIVTLNKGTVNEMSRVILEINGEPFEYVLKPNKHFYVTDSDGNPTRLSCFRTK
jgi:hypothetical protein